MALVVLLVVAVAMMVEISGDDGAGEICLSVQ